MAELSMESEQQGGDCIDITPQKDGGVIKRILRVGSSDDSPPAGNDVVVHYVGTLLNGDKFDSSRDRSEKFTFKLGKGQVINAWDLGVATMTRGELATFTCRADYAYGEKGSPPKIPGNATLVFEVELFDWKGEDLTDAKDGGIQREIQQSGHGYDSPRDGASVEVHLIGYLPDGQAFDDRIETFLLNEDFEKGIPRGVHIALTHFKKGEKSRLKIASGYAFGTTGDATRAVPPHATLEYDVTLRAFENTKESWELEVPEKIAQSEIFKTKGTGYFKEENYSQAIKYYTKVVDFLDSDKDEESEHTPVLRSLLLSARLNLAMCHLKVSDHVATRTECDHALKLDKNSEKALFRRAQAQAALTNHELAQADFQAVLAVAPDNRAARKQMAVCAEHLREERDREKKLYAGMFTKFAAQDAKDNEGDEAIEAS